AARLKPPAVRAAPRPARRTAHQPVAPAICRPVERNDVHPGCAFHVINDLLRRLAGIPTARRISPLSRLLRGASPVFVASIAIVFVVRAQAGLPNDGVGPLAASTCQTGVSKNHQERETAPLGRPAPGRRYSINDSAWRGTDFVDREGGSAL